MPARSILPNSSPEVLKPRVTERGVFQVTWIEQADMHGLFFTLGGTGDAIFLAAHNNGHSCARLADLLAARDLERAKKQLAYIQACGGLGCAQSALDWAAK